MIEVHFLGVGEAFDENLPNTSILIRFEVNDSLITLLLDCGFTAPPQFWKKSLPADALDGVWISHFHGDHCFGLPALLLRLWEEKRKKDLIIIGGKGIDAFTRNALDLAYPGFYEKLGFSIGFVEVEPNKESEIFGLSFRAAQNNHSQRDLALRIDGGGRSIYYSGDGRPTPECVALARGSRLIIHEAYHPTTEFPGHGTVRGCFDMAIKCEAKILALVHIQKDVRQEVIAWLKGAPAFEGSLNVIIPEPGFSIRL